MALPTPIQIDSILFTPSRDCSGPLAVVLHEFSSGIETLDLEMQRCPRRRPAQSPGCHSSFHYGVGSGAFHQYVPQNDTAWGFGLLTPSCPEPICEPTECESCSGLTVAQFNPFLDGTPPTLPSGWGTPSPGDGTANCRALHVAVTGITSTASEDCCNFFQNAFAYQQLVFALATIYIDAGITPTQSTLLVHCDELLCLDIEKLINDVNVASDQPEPIIVPCNCQPTSAQLELAFADLPEGDPAIPGTTVLIGADGETHLLPASAGDSEVLGDSTDSIDVTVVEAPANTFTVTADILLNSAITNLASIDSDGLMVTGSPILQDCGGDPVTAATPIITVEDLLGTELASNGPASSVVVGGSGDCPAIIVPPTCGDTVLQTDFNGMFFVGSDATGNNLQFHKLFQDPVVHNPGTQVAANRVVSLSTVRAAGQNVLIFNLDAAAGQNVVLNNPPTGECAEKHLWIKNIGVIDLTVQSAALIDGQGTITLDGTIPGGYPFGNDGGEAVHLIWSSTNSTWYVI